MADIYSKKKRSEIMSKIKSMDTKPEILLLKILRMVRSKGMIIRGQANIKGLKVDALIVRNKIAIFCDGCFYHGCPLI